MGRFSISRLVAVAAIAGAALAASPSEGPPADLTDGLRIAFGLPRIAAANAYLSRTMVVEAVYQATALSGGALMGRVVNTGTLAPGFGGAYQYSPQPADRLVVHYGGQVHEFVVRVANGNPQAATSDAWLLSPHELRYVHRIDGQAEAELAVQYDGSAFEITVQGWTTQWGARYDLDLVASGRVGGVRDYDGQDIQTVYDLTLYGGSRYELRDVQIQSGTQARGGQSSAGMTGLSGAVSKDGRPFGQFVLLKAGAPF